MKRDELYTNSVHSYSLNTDSLHRDFFEYRVTTQGYTEYSVTAQGFTQCTLNHYPQTHCRLSTHYTDSQYTDLANVLDYRHNGNTCIVYMDSLLNSVNMEVLHKEIYKRRMQIYPIVRSGTKPEIHPIRSVK